MGIVPPIRVLFEIAQLEQFRVTGCCRGGGGEAMNVQGFTWRVGVRARCEGRVDLSRGIDGANGPTKGGR